MKLQNRTNGLRRLGVPGLLIFFLGFAACAAAAGLFSIAEAAQQRSSITVSAAISLKDALSEIGPMYEKRVPGATIVFTYGGSGMLAQQIEQGAPVDAFFPAAVEPMDEVKSKGLLADERPVEIVSNSLVLIAPGKNLTLKSFDDLTLAAVKHIAMGETATVPAGMYAKQTLERLKLFDGVSAKIVYAKDVRTVLTYVETGNADAGFVYATDAETSKKVRVVATAPADSHEPIVYPAAALKNSKNPELAKAFLDFLSGPDALAVFEKHGFVAPEKHAAKQ